MHSLDLHSGHNGFNPPGISALGEVRYAFDQRFAHVETAFSSQLSVFSSQLSADGSSDVVGSHPFRINREKDGARLHREPAHGDVSKVLNLRTEPPSSIPRLKADSR